MAATDVTELFAQAYANAARADVNMREATPALEEIRDTIREQSGFYRVLGAIQTQIGQVDVRRLAPILCRFRQSYLESVMRAEVTRLNAAFDRDANDGWQQWLTAYAEVYQENNWWQVMADALAGCLKSTPHSEWPVERVKRSVWLVASSRWPETYDWFMFLSEQNLTPAQKARMLSIAAETQVYRFTQYGRAQQLVDRAKDLAGDEHLILRVQAEIYRFTDRLADAERVYRKLVERKPSLVDGYTGLAECADARKDAVAAEAYYKQAVLYAPGEVSAHSGLMNWYARNMADHEAVVLSLFERVLALSLAPADEYVNLALQYREANDWTRARAHMQKALELAPDQTLPESWLGHFDLDEAKENPAVAASRRTSARSHFARDMEACPEAFDAPWGFSRIAIDEKDWAEADRWCERVLATNREWELEVRARQASIALSRADLPACERLVVRALELEPFHADARSTLFDLASKVEESGDTDRARRLLDLWRKISGTAVEHLFQNELGLWKYNAADYAAAIPFFEAASAAKPEDAVLRSNSASAAELLRSTDNRPHWIAFAIERLNAALRLAPDKSDYQRRLTALLVEQRFINVYGESGLSSVPTVTPLRLEIPRELIGPILNSEQTELSSESLAIIDSWLENYRARRGVTLPGVRFAFRGDSGPPDEFRMLIREHDHRFGKPSRGPLLTDVLDQLEAFVDTRIADLVGHEQTAALLRNISGDEASRILASPILLTMLVDRVRARLEQDLAIHDLPELAQAVLAVAERLPAQPPPPRPDLHSYLNPPVFSLFSRTALTAFPAWELARNAVFLANGVLLPAITFGTDEAISEGDFELRINGSKTDVKLDSRMSDDDLSVAIVPPVMSAPETLVVKPLIDWYLLKLSETAPALFASATAVFSTNDLIGLFRTRVRRGGSIRDLALTVEKILREYSDRGTPTGSTSDAHSGPH